MSDRFPADVEAELREGGWEPGRDIAAAADDVIGLVQKDHGAGDARHEPFPAAVAALREFSGVYVVQQGTGPDLRRRPFAIDPTMAATSAATLADFGRVLGERLFPLGVEGDAEAILAVDERGRVFSLDHFGEWFLGGTIDEALVTLVAGTLPPRVHDDGTW